MPIKKYYGGHGEEVMADMKGRYGEEKGKEVFYATANKRDQNPGDKKKSKKDNPVIARMKMVMEGPKKKGK
jgi:hypothetical protein